MQYMPTFSRRLLAVIAVCAQCVAAPAAPAQGISLPDLGDQSAAVITPAQERKLGEDLVRQARRRLAFVDDPEINEYIQSLGQRLVARSDAPHKDFRFFVIEDPTINAFALPGGFVGVHTGLILAAGSEAELASVLAHEIAHITQRHIPRMITESQRASLPAMAAVLAAVLLGASGHQGGDAALAATSATLQQRELNFTRAFEEEADRVGMTILAGADFDPRAMPAFFEHMQNLNRYNETSLPEFLRSHPITTSRIADSRNRAERYPYRQIPDSSAFHHARARIHALAQGDPDEIARAFRDNLAQGKFRDADAEHYGYALALMRARRLEAARTEIARLSERYPDRSPYHIVQAEIEMKAGRQEQALAIFAAARQRQPTDLPLLRAYANALLQAGRASEAKEIAKAALRRRADDPALYRLLARAAGDAGARIEAHQALGEANYLSGNFDAAIEQLQIATQLAADNFYLQTSLEARIQAIREEIALYRGK